MITSYEVGAVFKIVDNASATLKALAVKFNELDAIILRTQASMAKLTGVRLGSLNTRLAETGKQLAGVERSAKTAADGLALGFDKSIAGARALNAEMAAIAANARRIGGGGPALIGGGGAHPRPGRSGGGSRGGGGGVHFGTSQAIPGGHMSFSGPTNVAGMATLGGLAYGAYEEAKMQDALFQLLYHTGLPNTDANRKMFRGTIQNAMSESGYGLDSIIEAAKTESRMFKGTPGNGVDVLPEMLRAATIEARLKGTSPQESMNSLIGLAHMTKQYDPEAIKKLAPAFAFLSASNPASLSSIEKSAGYAVPILQSGLEMDPMQSLLLGTVLTRAGATSTKSGTWLRNMMMGAMPGTKFMSDKQAQTHKEAMDALGLTDANGKPTWFTDGKPDPFKMLEIASGRAEKIPLTDRPRYEHALFGAQGEGAFALLSDPAVRLQVDALKKEMNSAEFKNRYATFSQEYAAESPMQKGRTAWADFQNVMMDIGGNVLPPVTAALGGFDAVLKKLRATVGDSGTAGVAAGGMALGGMAMTGWGRAALAWGARTAAGAAGIPLFAATGLISTIAAGAANGDMKGAVLGGAGGLDLMPKSPGGKAPFLGLGVPTAGNLDAAKAAAEDVGKQSGAAAAKGFSEAPYHETGSSAASKLLEGFKAAIGGLFSKTGLSVAPYKGGGAPIKVNSHVHIDGREIHATTVRYEYRAATHSHQAPAFDGLRHFSTPDGQMWDA